MDVKELFSQYIVEVAVGLSLAIIGFIFAWLRKRMKRRPPKPTPSELRYHIYFSFPNTDRAEVEKVIPAIEKAGYKYFYDTQVDWGSITPGSDYYAPLEEALKCSRLILFFVSPNTPNAKGQLWEAEWIDSHPRSDLSVMPMFLTGAATKDLPEQFRRVAGVKIGYPIDQNATDEIVQKIEEVIGTPDDCPVQPTRNKPTPSS